jgi:hypothetical protein
MNYIDIGFHRFHPTIPTIPTVTRSSIHRSQHDDVPLMDYQYSYQKCCGIIELLEYGKKQLVDAGIEPATKKYM